MEFDESPGAASELPELLPARMLNEFVYCPRLFYLEWVSAEWADSSDTARGTAIHKRVDRPAGKPSPAEAGEDVIPVVAQSVELSSEEEGLIARLDLLEVNSDGAVPVDFKKGSLPPDGMPWPADRIQLGVQALLLRSHGYECHEAIAYYSASRRRVSMVVDEELLDEVREVARSARAVAAQPLPPQPLLDSPKCPRCSLQGICLPDETLELSGVQETKAHLTSALAPRVDDALPVVVQDQGARVGKKGETMVIRRRSGEEVTVRMIDISQLCLMGNISVSAQVIAELMKRDIPICHFSYGGWFHGVTHTIGSRNAALRMAQYRVATVRDRALDLSRGLVVSKIKNQRTLLRRNHSELKASVLSGLLQCASKAEDAVSREELLGHEGLAAKLYFGSFDGMLRDSRHTEFDFNGRNRRPPRDPVNALLSLAYSILAKDWTVTLFAVGLDPYIGVYHAHRFGRASLALDLMEEFRPLIADSVVLQLINNGEVDEGSFIRRGASVALTPAGRKKFFAAYERRMSHQITHPIFGYKLSYRRLLEVQARLFGKALQGELGEYPGFTTR